MTVPSYSIVNMAHSLGINKQADAGKVPWLLTDL